MDKFNYLKEQLTAALVELEAKDALKDIRIAELEKRLKQRAEEVESHIAELEAHKQYAKERDAENESLSLTVGRLRVELEAKDRRIAELEAKLATPVRLVAYRNSPDMHTKQYYEAIGFNQGIDACYVAVRAAGFTVEDKQ